MNRLSDRSAAIVGVVCLVLLAASLFMRIDLNSDTLFLDALMNDLFVSHGAWSAWRFSPAPSYFPDMLVYGIACLVFKAPSLRIWFVTVFQIVAISWLSDRLLLRIRPGVTPFCRALLLAAACGLVAVASHTTTMIGIFFNADNIQVPTLISSLLLAILTCDSLDRRRSTRTSWAMLLVGSLAYASSTLFLLSFVIPCLATLVAIDVLRIDVGTTRSALRRTFGLIVASQMCGWLLARALTRNAPLEGRLTLDPGRAFLALQRFGAATANLVAPGNLWSASLFLVCLAAWVATCRFAIGLFVNRRIVGTSGHARLIALFVASSSITSIGGALASGGFGDLYGYRYFMTFAAVSVVWTIAWIDRRIAASRSVPSWFVVPGVVALATASLGQTFVESHRGFAEVARHGAIARPEESVASCLDTLARQGTHLDGGIADYWYARGVRYQLEIPVRIEPVAADLSPFFWISSLSPVEHPAHYGIERYNFAIVRNRLPDVMAGFDLSLMRAQLPAGFETHRCEAADADILVYRSDALDTKVRMRFDNFLFRKEGTGRLAYAGAELPGQVGHVEAAARVVDGGSPGYLIFGPYLHLDAGHYRLEVRYHATGTVASSAIATVDVGRFDVPPATPFAKTDLRGASAGVARLDFVVPAGGASHVETRVFYAGGGHLDVDEIGIVRRPD